MIAFSVAMAIVSIGVMLLLVCLPWPNRLPNISCNLTTTGAGSSSLPIRLPTETDHFLASPKPHRSF
jgi:hypothetical protein